MRFFLSRFSNQMRDLDNAMIPGAKSCHRSRSEKEKRRKSWLAKKTIKRSHPISTPTLASLFNNRALAASVALLGIANQAMAIGVMKARKRFGVEFPDLYAKESQQGRV